MDIDQWRFLLQTFPLEMDQIMTGEVLNGNNPAGDARILSAIVAAEDVIDPARHTPDPSRAAPMGMDAILEAFKPLAPNPKPVAKAVTDAELVALKLAYADAFLAYEQTDVDDPNWDAAHNAWENAGKVLWQAFRYDRKAGGR